VNLKATACEGLVWTTLAKDKLQWRILWTR